SPGRLPPRARSAGGEPRVRVDPHAVEPAPHRRRSSRPRSIRTGNRGWRPAGECKRPHVGEVHRNRALGTVRASGRRGEAIRTPPRRPIATAMLAATVPDETVNRAPAGTAQVQFSFYVQVLSVALVCPRVVVANTDLHGSLPRQSAIRGV